MNTFITTFWGDILKNIGKFFSTKFLKSKILCLISVYKVGPKPKPRLPRHRMVEWEVAKVAFRYLVTNRPHFSKDHHNTLSVNFNQTWTNKNSFWFKLLWSRNYKDGTSGIKLSCWNTFLQFINIKGVDLMESETLDQIDIRANLRY